tara:strand:+ start:570 stop:1178 length:609 start_codon:yes stop_codon:yes gene_type:complete
MNSEHSPKSNDRSEQSPDRSVIPADSSTSLEKATANPQTNDPVSIEQTDLESSSGVLLAAQRFAGPLPSPQHLAQYGEIRSDLPERIVAMAEREQSFRHEMGREASAYQKSQGELDRDSIKWDDLFRRRGQVLAAIIAFIAIGCGTYLIRNGHPLSGSGLAGGTLVAIVTAFLTDRFTQPTTEELTQIETGDSTESQEASAT